MRKRKQLLLFVLSLMMIFSSAFVYGAEANQKEDSAVIMRMIAGGDLSLTRLGDKKAELEVSADSSTTAEYIKAICTVQKLNTSTKKYSDYGNTFELKATNTCSLYKFAEITVDVSGTYRVKVIFEDKTETGISRTSAYYTQAVGL